MKPFSKVSGFVQRLIERIRRPRFQPGDAVASKTLLEEHLAQAQRWDRIARCTCGGDLEKILEDRLVTHLLNIHPNGSSDAILLPAISQAECRDLLTQLYQAKESLAQTQTALDRFDERQKRKQQ